MFSYYFIGVFIILYTVSTFPIHSYAHTNTHTHTLPKSAGSINVNDYVTVINATNLPGEGAMYISPAFTSHAKLTICSPQVPSVVVKTGLESGRRKVLGGE